MDYDYTKFNIDDFIKMFRKDLMHVDIVGKIKTPNVRIEKTEDYYNFFVSMLHTEEASLHNMEHLWVLGINEEGYSKCAYLVGYGHEITFDYDAHQLLGTNITHRCKKIVLAYHKNTTEKIKITNFDVYFASSVYYRAAIMGIKLHDYIIISSAYHEITRTPERPDYASLKESNFMNVVSKGGVDINKDIDKIIQEDRDKNTRERYLEEAKLIGLRSGIEQGMRRGKEEGQLKRNIEIAINMLAKNMQLEVISEITGLSVEEIERIKSEI